MENNNGCIWPMLLLLVLFSFASCNTLDNIDRTLKRIERSMQHE